MAFTTCFSRFLFLSAIILSHSVSSFSLLLLPLFFPNVVHALAVAPALCTPARVARAMASDFHANLNVAAAVVSGTLTACGSTPFAVWGALPKRRGNAGSDSELSYHWNTFLEVRWDCVSRSRSRSLTLTLTLTLPLSLSLSLSHSPSLSLSLSHSLTLPAQRVRLSLRAHARTFPALSPLSRSPSFFSLLFFVFVFALSSSLSYFLLLRNSFLLFFFTSGSSSLCFSSLLSSSSHLFPPKLMHVGSSHFWLPAQLLGGVDVGSRTKDLSSNVAFFCEVVRRRE